MADKRIKAINVRVGMVICADKYDDTDVPMRVTKVEVTDAGFRFHGENGRVRNAGRKAEYDLVG